MNNLLGNPIIQKKIRTMINQAKEYIFKDDLNSAEKILKKSVYLFGKNLETNLLLGKVYEIKGNYEDSLVNFHQEYSISGNDVHIKRLALKFGLDNLKNLGFQCVKNIFETVFKGQGDPDENKIIVQNFDKLQLITENILKKYEGDIKLIFDFIPNLDSFQTKEDNQKECRLIQLIKAENNIQLAKNHDLLYLIVISYIASKHIESAEKLLDQEEISKFLEGKSTLISESKNPPQDETLEIMNSLNYLQGSIYLAFGKRKIALKKFFVSNLEGWKDHSEKIAKNLYIESKKLLIDCKHQLALIKLNEGIEIVPESTDILIFRAFIFRTTGKYEDALKDLDVASEILNREKEDSAEISVIKII